MTDQGGTHNAISGGIFFSAVIQGRDITVQLPREITPALSGLPAATPAFTGRQADLDVLLGALAPRPAGTGPPGVSASRTVAVTAVGGLAGVGKTELAVQAAHTVLANGWFPGGVLFADLFGYDEVRRLEPAQALEGFLRALGIPGEHIPPQAQDRARLYASVLAAYAEQGQGVLVVADNVYASEQAEPLLPTDGINAALVTSRDTLGLLNARLLDLDVLTPEAAACMLDRTLRVARPGDSRVTDCPGDAAAIARTCGGLPLALRIIAALLAEDPARPLAAMAADLRDERTRLDEISYANTGVRAAFDLSYQRLDPGHARLFRLLTVNPGPDISTQTAAALTGHDQAVTRRELEALARAHLIEHGSGYGRWRMHDLVRLYADQHGRSNAQADARDEAYIRLLNHYLDTTIAASAHLDPAVADPATREFNEREQALAWLDAEYPNLTSVTYAAASRGHLAVARDLPRAMWHFLSWRRHFNDWITLATIASNAADRLGDPRGEAVARASLAAALHGARRFEEAITAWQHAAQIFRDTGDRNGEAGALSNLGLALQGVARFEEAITACQEAAQIFRDTGDRHREGMALSNLGSALQQAARFEEAITACQEAAQILRDTGDRHSEAMALNNLGATLVQMELFQEAFTACLGAGEIFQDTGDWHGAGEALSNLGIALREMGRFEEAITACQYAALFFRETHDEYNEGIALANLEEAQQATRQA